MNDLEYYYITSANSYIINQYDINNIDDFHLIFLEIEKIFKNKNKCSKLELDNIMLKIKLNILLYENIRN